MNTKAEYITQEEAATRLGVSRGALYYYMRELKIERKKFPLDKHAYLRVADFEKIKALKEQAVERGTSQEESEVA